MPSDRAGRTVPAVSATAVTASDATTYPSCRAIWVGGAGDLAVLMRNDTVAVTFASVPAGTLLPFDAIKVMATNTTATSIAIVF